MAVSVIFFDSSMKLCYFPNFSPVTSTYPTLSQIPYQNKSLSKFFAHQSLRNSTVEASSRKLNYVEAKIHTVAVCMRKTDRRECPGRVNLAQRVLILSEMKDR